MSKISFEIRKVNPKQAQEYLDNLYPRQRTVRQWAVTRYTDDMKSGRWGLSNDSIVQAADGQLVNGQHRMLSVIASGKTVTFSFMVIPTKDVDRLYKEMDQGVRRSPVDYLKGLGLSHAAERSAMLSAMWRFDTELRLQPMFLGGLRPSHHQLQHWMDTNDQSHVDGAISLYSKDLQRAHVRPKSAVMALYIVQARDIDQVKARRFWEAVANDDTVERTGPWLLRQRIERERNLLRGGTQTLPMVRGAVAIRAWNLYYDRRTAETIAWDPYDEFPKMRGLEV